MPAKRFPSKPDLNHLKYQAKDLRKGHAAHDPVLRNASGNSTRASVGRRMRRFSLLRCG